MNVYIYIIKDIINLKYINTHQINKEYNKIRYRQACTYVYKYTNLVNVLF